MIFLKELSSEYLPAQALIQSRAFLEWLLLAQLR
jgi:hypothetical protein